MNKLQISVRAMLRQLENSITLIDDGQYNSRIETLSGASIGQHTRHILELYLCLEQGYNTGIVNYEKRKRDILIETSRVVATDLIHQISNNLYNQNKELTLETGFDEGSAELISLPSNYYRELVYNIEHTIHHMALVKIAFREVSAVQLPDGYGVAPSTIKYRKLSTTQHDNIKVTPDLLPDF